jgi:hypothetical protein
MKKVSSEIINGSKAIYNLTQIIIKACHELGYECSWIPATGPLYTGQWIAKKLRAYFVIDQSSLLFGSSKTQPNLPEMNIEFHNHYCIKFDFDKYYFFDKNLEGQVATIKEFIKELLVQMV